MTVLIVLGILVFFVILFLIIIKFNNYTYEKNRFYFFSYETYALATVFYALIFFGVKWYMSELLIRGDVLNGIILVSLGVIGFIGVMCYNLKRTNFKIGMIGTILQLIIYLPLSLFGILMFFGLISMLSSSRSTYVINN